MIYSTSAQRLVINGGLLIWFPSGSVGVVISDVSFPSFFACGRHGDGFSVLLVSSVLSGLSFLAFLGVQFVTFTVWSDRLTESRFCFSTDTRDNNTPVLYPSTRFNLPPVFSWLVWVCWWATCPCFSCVISVGEFVPNTVGFDLDTIFDNYNKYHEKCFSSVMFIMLSLQTTLVIGVWLFTFSIICPCRWHFLGCELINLFY